MLKFDDASPKLSELVGQLAPGFFDPLELAVAPDGAFADLAFDLLVTSEERDDGVTIARSGKSPVIFGRSADFAKRSEEHTSELQSLMRTSYAVFCLKKKKKYQSKTSIFQSTVIKKSHRQ